MDIRLNALPILPVLARTVSGCLNCAFLGLFYTSCGPSLQAMDTQVTRQRSGTGRPSVEGDRPVRRPCPSQRNKSHKKENARQSQLCSMPASPSRRAPAEAVTMKQTDLPLLLLHVESSLPRRSPNLGFLCLGSVPASSRLVSFETCVPSQSWPLHCLLGEARSPYLAIR